MQAVKIGVYDREREYAQQLAAYLQKWNKCGWQLAAFTEEDVVFTFIEKRSVDVLVGTDRNVLRAVRKRYEKMPLIWLAEDKGQNEQGLQAVYRYQSAEEIGRQIKKIVLQNQIIASDAKQMVAVYSPVGRCGKTTLALEIIRNGDYGKWLYFGMEDYSSFLQETEENVVADDIIYYIKERNQEKVLALMEESGGIITSARSVFDAKEIDRTDMHWLKEVLKESSFKGILFDVGTGVLRDYDIFAVFDYLLVPYIQENISLAKTENFKKVFDIWDLQGMDEKMHFVDMNRADEVKQCVEQIFGGS